MKKNTLIIWKNLNARLINFINQKVKNLDRAKDINQDVFIKVFSKIDTLKDKDKMIPWIYQITRNEINNYFRKHKFSNEIEISEKPEFLDENLTLEFSKCITPMIDALPEKYKQAIHLTEIEGMSQKDLAKQLGISYSGAKSRVQRGRDMLKILFEQCCEISSDAYGNIIDYKKKGCSKDCG